MNLITDLSSLVGREVFVYRNLTNKCLSIKDIKINRVCGYADSLTLSDVRFIVSESGRRRVLSSRRKNVHAYIKGTITQVNTSIDETHSPVLISYNPYKFSHFYCVSDNSPIYSGECCYVNRTGVICLYN